MTLLNKDPRGADKMIYISYAHEDLSVLNLLLFKTMFTQTQITGNFNGSRMHHEEGIQHLTLRQLKPQLGFIKEEGKVPHSPQWKLANG